MAHPKLTVETFDGSSQVSVEGLLQLTVLEDGTAIIDLAGRQVEVERSGLQYVVRHETATQVEDAPAARFGSNTLRLNDHPTRPQYSTVQA